jgi:hypothetical protein
MLKSIITVFGASSQYCKYKTSTKLPPKHGQLVAIITQVSVKKLYLVLWVAPPIKNFRKTERGIEMTYEHGTGSKKENLDSGR